MVVQRVLLLLLLLVGLVGLVKGFASPQWNRAMGQQRRSLVKAYAGEELFLSEENVELVLEECKETIGSMFGNSAENRGVGITGDVDLVELDGPTVILALRGRFWHKRDMVLARVGAFLQERIPEIISVEVSDESMLLEENNDFEAAAPSLEFDAQQIRSDQW